jgi:hypothetical protein
MAAAARLVGWVGLVVTAWWVRTVMVVGSGLVRCCWSWCRRFSRVVWAVVTGSSVGMLVRSMRWCGGWVVGVVGVGMGVQVRW